MKSCIYLRKSRADEELEKINPGDTLSRHKETLIKIANEKELIIVNIHEEIVSGESLNQRPQMLKLLEEVSNNEYDAVLVMDIDRLGRGNMQEQGLILDTFKQSKTKIITPRKIYDLNDEFDEEYSEFEAFMARKELKLITRRMQRGRKKSIEEGNYIGTYAPYGYKIEGQGRSRKLVIDTSTAPVIKLIFEMYAVGKGGNHIAYELNKLGYKTATGRDFYNNSIINIIKNPVYTGKVTWKKKDYTILDSNKRKTVRLNPREKWIITEGKHEAIISEELYNQALAQLMNKTHVPYKTKMTNPLAGLIFCSECHKPMVYRSYAKSVAHIICCNPNCKATKSSRFDYVEKEVLNKLQMIIQEYKSNIPKFDIDNDNSTKLAAIKNIKSEIDKLSIQKDKLHDLLEQGVYSIDTFLERSEIINTKLDKLNFQLQEIESELTIKPKPKFEIAEILKDAVDGYLLIDDVELKNQALKSVIKEIIYSKPKANKSGDFDLIIHLNI